MFNPLVRYMALALVILSISIYFLFSKWRTALTERNQVITYHNNTQAELKHYKNRVNGLEIEVAKKGASALDISSLQALSKSKDLEWLKQFEGLKSNLKNLESAVNLNAEYVAKFSTIGKDTTTLVNGIETPAFSFENKTKYMLETGIVIPSLKQVNSNLRIEVPIQSVVYWQRKKFLLLRIGKKEYFTEITSPNEDVHITQMDQVLVKKK